MLREFPVIRTFDDVYPAISGRKEFSVIRTDDYTVVDYNVQTEDTFDMTEHGMYRQECRGLMFSPDGNIISRPFHKFFNLGERTETLPHNIDWTDYPRIEEKLDGSMIRPFLLNGKIEFATRKGITDVALEAKKVFERLDEEKEGRLSEFFLHWLNRQYTPILEYVGPRNRIVVSYKDSNIVLLAMRHNIFGSYRMGDMVEGKVVSISKLFPGDSVSFYYVNRGGSLDEYVKKVRGEEGREGDVVVFPNGFRIKVKSEWYVNLHRLKNEVGRERFVAMRSLDNTLDDVIGLLSDKDQEEISDIASSFMASYSTKLANLREVCLDISGRLQNDGVEDIKKTAALEYIPKLKSKLDSKYVFAYLDGRDIDEMFEADVRKQLQKESRYEEMCKWFKVLQ